MISTSIANTNWQTLIFSKSGLTTNIYYKFAVSAYNVIGESPKVLSIPIITATVPDQPIGLSLISQDKSHIKIGWSDPLNEGGTTLQNYIVEMDSGRLKKPGVFKTMSIQLN